MQSMDVPDWVIGVVAPVAERPYLCPVQKPDTLGHQGRRCRVIREVIRKKQKAKKRPVTVLNLSSGKVENRVYRTVLPTVRVTDEEQFCESAVTCRHWHCGHTVVHLHRFCCVCGKILTRHCVK